MKKAEAIEVGFKVVGMYAFMQGITALGLPISLHESAIAMRAALQGRAAAMPEIFSPLELVPALLLFFLGAFLLLEARKARLDSQVEKRLAEATEGEASLTPSMLRRIIFSALGILIVAESISPLASVINAMNLRDRHLFIVNPSLYYRIAEGLIKLVFGCWLIIGSRLRKVLSGLLDSLG